MFKIFIKHWIFEKCIDVFFDGIAKSFNKPNLKYEKLGIKNERKGDLIIKTLTHEHKGEIYKVRLSVDDSFIRDMMKTGISEDHMHDILEKELKMQVEMEVKLQEDPDYFENHPEDFTSVDMEDNLPPESFFDSLWEKIEKEISSESK